MTAITRNFVLALIATIGALLADPLLWAGLSHVAGMRNPIPAFDLAVMAAIIVVGHVGALFAMFHWSVPEHDANVHSVDRVPTFIATLLILLSLITSVGGWMLAVAFRDWNPG